MATKENEVGYISSDESSCYTRGIASPFTTYIVKNVLGMRNGILWYRYGAHTTGQLAPKLLGLTEDTGTMDTEYGES